MRRLITFLLFLAFAQFGCIEILTTMGSIKSDPKLAWKTFRTPNFEVHFHDGIESEAHRVAQFCEEAHTLLKKEMNWEPWGKVHVVVADLYDRPNAKAVEFPYPQLLILLARPGVDDALQSYDDWLRMVVIHEYTHIMHMDMAEGFWGAMRYVLGRIILPNGMVPGWMSEGYAVFQETDKTTAGRNRSTYVDMVLRMDALENHFPPIDTLNVRSGSWPYGAQAYFHGGRFFQWLAEKYPEAHKKFADYHHRYSSHVLNFLVLEMHARRVFGKSFPTLYREFQKDLRAQYDQQKAALEAQGLTSARRLTRDQEAKSGLLYSPDGESLLYSQASGDERVKFLKIRAHSEKPSIPRVEMYDFGAADMVWDAEYKKIYYSGNVNWRDYYIYSRMSTFDLATKKVSTIHFGGDPFAKSEMPRNPYASSRRTFNPHLSPSGKDLIFVAREAKADQLFLASEDEAGNQTWNQKKYTVSMLTDAPPGTEFNHPRFSPDGTSIAVSMFDPAKKRRDLVLITKDGKKMTNLTDDAFHDERPFWGANTEQLYFVSDRNGVFNVYLLHLKTGKIQQVTNVIGGTFSPTLSPDGTRLAFLGYHARGFDVYEMDLDPRSYRDWPAKKMARQDSGATALWDPSNEEVETPAPRVEDQEGKEKAYPYTPLPEAILPRFLAPYFQIVNDDDFYLGGSTGSTDPLRKHVWRLEGYYRTKINKPGGRAYYAYTGWYPEIFLSGSESPIAQSGTLLVRSPISGNVFSVNGQFDDNILVQRDIIGKIGMSMNIPIQRVPGLFWTPGKHRVTGGYEYIARRNWSDINPLFVQFSGAPAPTMVFVPTEYNASGFFLDYSYDSAIHRKRGISPTGDIDQVKDFLRGYSLSVGYEFFNDDLGGNWDQHVLTADFRTYRRIPYTKHHVLALRGIGGFTFGDDSNPETFLLGGSYSEGTRNTTTRNFYPLRGFGGGIRRGERMFMLSGEYRFPIWVPERGIYTLPLFVKNIHGAFFADYGDARDRFYLTNDNLVFNRGLMGVGGELRSEFTLFYNARIDARLGYGIPVLANKNAFFNFGDGELILNLGTTF